MILSRIRNGCLNFGRKTKQKRKITRRKRTGIQGSETAFLGPILAGAIGLVLTGYFGKII